MSDEQKKTTEEIKKQNELLEEQLKILKERTAEAEKSLKKMQDGAALALRQNDSQSHALETERALITLNEKKIAADEKELQRLEYRKEMGLELSDSEKTSLKNLGKSIEARQQENKELADSNKRKAVGHDIAKGIASTMLGINKNWKSTWWGQLSSGGGFSEKISQLGKSFSEAVNPADMLGSTLMKIQESTMASFLTFDSTTASLAAATGQGTKYNDMIMDISDSNRGFGVGIAESAEAIRGLNDTMSDFVNLSDEVAGAMAAQAAQLSKLGVSATITGKLNNQFMKGMGMTADQAMAVNNDLARTAMGLGIPVAKMAGDFEAALPKLAAWGSEAPKIFKKVAAAAKGLGVEMNTLLGFASQFDTFEGSATAVGKLNNILGGDLLNSYDMLNASEEQRVRMLLQGVEASGKSWESMGRFERRAVASAAGITDMAEANNLFAGGLSAYDDAQRKAQANAVSQKELEERTAAAVSVQDKMKQIIEAMAVAVAPLVSFMHGLTNAILAVNDATGGMLVPVVLGAIAVFAVFYNIMKGMLAVKAMYSLATDKEIIKKGASTAASVTQTAAEAASAATKGTLAAASAAAGAGMQAQALGQRVVGTTAPIATAGVSTFFGALTTFAASGVGALVIGAVVLLAISLAVAAVAAAAMVYSLVSLVKAFMEMPAAIIPALLGLTMFLAIILTFVVAVAALAPVAQAFALSAAMIGMGFMAMAPGLLAFSVAAGIFAVSMSQFDKGVFASMLGLMLIFPFFAASMLYSAPMMLMASVIMSQATAIMGVAFLVLALGLFAMGFSIPVMIALAVVLPMFAMSMLISALPMYAAALLLAPAAALLGVGLGILGIGLMAFTPQTAATMALLAFALPMFAAGLLLAVVPMWLAASTFAPAALLIGIGLGILGLALKLFDNKSAGTMALLGLALIPFAVGLVIAAPLMWKAALMFAPAALMVGIGLGALGLAIGLFDRKSIKSMYAIVPALIAFSLGLVFATPFLYAAAGTFVLPAIAIGIGLAAIGLALKLFNNKSFKAMENLAIALPLFALSLALTSVLMAPVGLPFLTGMAAASAGLALLGLALRTLPDDAGSVMSGLAIGLPLFALGLAFAAPLLLASSTSMFVASLLLAPALYMLAGPLYEFAEAVALMAPVASQMFVLALALAVMGPALAIFAFSMIAVGIAASMPFFSTGIGVFKDAISSMATSFEAIPTEKAQALGDFFSSLAKLTELNNVAEVMWAIAGGIYGVSAALAFMPEEKAFALSEVVNSVTRAAVEVTPEKVENVTGLVEQAAAYADVQAKFKAPSVDAFVQALKQVSGDSGSGSGSSSGRGKDIVLELNGREIGRAIDVHLDDKHNLRSN